VVFTLQLPEPHVSVDPYCVNDALYAAAVALNAAVERRMLDSMVKDWYWSVRTGNQVVGS
jgi:hypothetical protein